MKNPSSLRNAAEHFLSLRTIAITGLSRTKKDAASLIYTTLRSRGYKVFAVHPDADTLEGDTCYKSFSDIPECVGGLIIAGSPAHTLSIVKNAKEAGIRNIWIHKSIGSSVTEDAVQFCLANGVQVIPGGCPMMFSKPVDFGHVCLRGILGVLGRIPKNISSI